MTLATAPERPCSDHPAHLRQFHLTGARVPHTLIVGPLFLQAQRLGTPEGWRWWFRGWWNWRRLWDVIR